MNRWLLIDGHNVIHADADLARLMNPDPERARLELERIIAGRRRTTVFHDGGPGGEARSLRRRGVSVVYSGTGEADDVIIRWLKQHPTERAAVVSDDRELGRRVRQFGGQLIPARSFLHHARKQVDGPVNEAPLPPHEVDFWMREFGINETNNTR